MPPKKTMQYIHKIGDPSEVLKGPFKGGPKLFGEAPAGYKYAKGLPPEGFSRVEPRGPLSERLMLILKGALEAADADGKALTPLQEAQLLSLRPAIQSHIELGRLGAAKAQLESLTVPVFFRAAVANMIAEIEKETT